MKGYIRRRGPSWELRAYLGRGPVPGRKRYATRSVRGSKRAAERVLRDMVGAAEAGVTHRAGATFGELCEMWLTHASGHLAANTVTETRRILDRTLLPRLGDVALAGLRPEHLDALYADLLCSGRRDGGSMSPATVQRIHGVVRRALTVAVRWGWLAANPAFIAMPPRSTRRAAARVPGLSGVGVICGRPARRAPARGHQCERAPPASPSCSERADQSVVASTRRYPVRSAGLRGDARPSQQAAWTPRPLMRTRLRSRWPHGSESR
jgi:Phage integrase, N-terminal SAM-like domain